jgi:hypothetical protein
MRHWTEIGREIYTSIHLYIYTSKLHGIYCHSLAVYVINSLYYIKIKFLLDAEVHSKHGLLIRYDIRPRSVKNPRDVDFGDNP